MLKMRKDKQSLTAMSLNSKKDPTNMIVACYAYKNAILFDE